MKENIATIKKQIEEAARRSGRDPKEITLIAVSKTYPLEKVEEAIECGCNDFGENKVQEVVQKIPLVSKPVNWHFIGHLQTNKVKYIVEDVTLIHSVDSIKLAKEINKQADKRNRICNVLVEVNVAKEESKHGIEVEEVVDFLKEMSTLKSIKVKGFMTVAPFVENPEENRSVFRKLYNLSVDIQKQNIDNIDTDILSMGMSNDFEIAIEEGATMIRIGTKIFGTREYDKNKEDIL
jgi:hypothetical protein